MNYRFWQWGRTVKVWVLKNYVTGFYNKIVCAGSPRMDNLDKLHGPFQTEEAAEEYADRMNSDEVPMYVQPLFPDNDEGLERVYQAAKSYIDAYKKGNLTMGAIFFGQLEKHVETVAFERGKAINI